MKWFEGVALALVGTLAGCASAPKMTPVVVPPVDDGSASRADQETFHSVAAGFSITKPRDWHFASLQEIADSRARVRLNDEQLNELVKSHASVPLVVILKHAEPYETLNPTIQVILRPLGRFKGMPATQVLELATGPIRKAVTGFSFVVPIQPSTVGGVAGAYMKAAMTVQDQSGKKFPALSRMWLVPRGDFLLMMSASGPSSGPDVAEAEFEAALASVKIEP